jgi:hypothetical protein
MTTDAGPTDAVTFAVELEAVLFAASKLPVCDRAAKLHALVTRMRHAAETAAGAGAAADALAFAAAAALADDPWVQFQTEVRRFQSCVSTAGSI